jgi:hypothetical protein
MPKFVDLIVGVGFLLSGALMLWQLPRYQRRVESGEVLRDKSSPSFKTLRRAAIGVLFLGVLSIFGWSFGLL